MSKLQLMGLIAAGGLASAAFGDVWVEVGDAGELLPGQITVGTGSLDFISGTIAGSEDVDLYCIRITDVANFSATSVGGADFDTQLFLFDANGLGVSFNDDDPGGGGLQSTITGMFVTSPGLYYLALSAYSNDALNGDGDEIWLDSPYGQERAPDGPGAPGPLASWNHSGFNQGGAYRLTLTGAGFCEVPAPASLALLGLGGLAIRRRRRG